MMLVACSTLQDRRITPPVESPPGSTISTGTPDGLPSVSPSIGTPSQSEETVLSGAIQLSTIPAKPISTSIELHTIDDFQFVEPVATDSEGIYRVIGGRPGIFNLWILISSNSEFVGSCTDLVLPDSDWSWGIIAGGVRGILFDTLSRNDARLLSSKLQAPGLLSDDFFAVRSEVELKSGAIQVINLDIKCN
jgi:hypothetical protein